MTQLRRFRALFGLSPTACAVVWRSLGTRKPIKSRPEHLLYALMLLKLYGTEHEHHAITGRDEKTFRKYSWSWVCLLALHLNVVREINSLINSRYHVLTLKLK